MLEALTQLHTQGRNINPHGAPVCLPFSWDISMLRVVRHQPAGQRSGGHAATFQGSDFCRGALKRKTAL